MKRFFLHIALLLVGFLACAALSAQAEFQTIVTKGPVIVGESFQVQYVLEEADKDSEFFAPDFKGFRFVSGPNIYTGSAYGASGTRKLKNIVYTLAATNTGKFMVPGASARIENRLYKSNNVWLQVISRAEANKRKDKQQQQQVNEDIYLSPGEDAYAKIRRNLFMKVLVDKNSCFVGEPVTAIFKLYSRLDSKSDIVKNPGFYGFTVQDMINLEDRASSTEIINGKNFDVHIVRKVQLYPLQAGVFQVDAMEVRNKVKFSKSAVNKSAEQEIIEGVVPEVDEEEEDANTLVFENEMATQPIAILVNAVPQKNKPADYNGATGNFVVDAAVLKKELAKNEEGRLVITISGKGNFTQLSAPVIQWPEGIDVFEPLVMDSLDHMQSPMNGKREFHFRFLSSRAGDYELPAVDFSFFNPDTNAYKTLHTLPGHFKVTNRENPGIKLEAYEKPGGGTSWTWLWLAGIGLFLFTGFLFYRFGRNKIRKPAEPVVTAPVPIKSSVAEILHPAAVFSKADDKTFYSILRNCIWNFFAQRFELSGSQVNKHRLSAMMKQKGIDENNRESILEILMECETGIFTSAEGIGNKEAILEKTNVVLGKINQQAG